MSWFNFLKLIYQLYGAKEVDLNFIKSQGLLAIKIGQAHALRIDFLDEAKCQQLVGLYRSAGALTPSDAKSLLIASVSSGFMSRFADIDYRPLAAASVGQVHKGHLTDGTAVAIKLVKGDFAETFKRDVRAARRVFRFATWFYPRLRGVANPIAILNNIETMTLRELDLRHEYAGQQELKAIHQRYAGRFDLAQLDFIKVYHGLSNDRVMVSQLLTGPTLDQLISQGRLDYAQLLDLFKIHGFYMFCVGTFHGDIHPGNVIVQDGKFYFLDTGFIGRANDKIRTGLFHFFDALSAYDYERSAYWLNQMSARPIAGERYQEFVRRFQALYADFTNKTVSEVSLTKKMYQTIRLGVLSGMDFGEDIFDIIKSLMYMDGMVLRVKPDAILLKDMRRYIDQFRRFI